MLYSLLMTGALASAVFAMVCYLVSRKDAKADKLPPGPAPWPVIGNLALLRGDIFQALSTLRKQYGDVYRLYMGKSLVVFLHGEEACREMLLAKGDDFVDRPKDFIGENVCKGRGIVYTSGPLWKTQRRFALHTLKNFGFGKSSLEGKIHEEILSLIDWTSDRSVEGGPFSIDKMINTSVVNVLCSITFGHRYNINNPEFIGYLRAKDELIEALSFSGALVFLPWVKSLPGDFFKYHRTLANYSTLEEFISVQIQEHKAALDPENPRDFIDAYLNEIARTQGQSTFGDKQLCGSIVELFIAGSETTSTTLIWALLFLVNHPNVQTRVRAEIHSVVGKSRLPSVRDRENLPYLEATIRETQRCADVVPLGVPRAARVSSTLGSYVIPQGATVIPVMASLHQDPNVWPIPAKFDPARFLGPDGSVITTGHFLPFSAGRRNCLGESLAKMELFLFLAALLQKFVFLPPDGVSSLPVESTLGATKVPKPFLIRVTPIS